MKKLLILFAVLMTAVLISCGENQAKTEEKSSEPQASVQADSRQSDAPDFELKDARGNTVRLSDFKGKMVIVNFWATWCGPCRMEIPGFIKMYDKYRDQGLEIVGISLDQQGWPAVKPFMDHYQINYPILMGNQQIVMDYGGIEAIPTTFIVNPEGEVVEKIVGLRPESYFENSIHNILNIKG